KAWKICLKKKKNQPNLQRMMKPTMKKMRILMNKKTTTPRMNKVAWDPSLQPFYISNSLSCLFSFFLSQCPFLFNTLHIHFSFEFNIVMFEQLSVTHGAKRHIEA